MNPLATFKDAAGFNHDLYGVSLYNFETFWKTYNNFIAALRLAETQYESFEQLYQADSNFRQDTNKLLELNGIDLRWVTLPQLSELLLYRTTDKGVAPGLLVEINTPRGIREVSEERAEVFKSEDQSFFWDSIVALSTYTNDANAAIELSKKLNSTYISDLVDAQRRFNRSQDPESKSKLDSPSASRKAEVERLLNQHR